MRPFAVTSIVYIVLLICSAVAAFTYKLRSEGIFACAADGYARDTYLGYCNATWYGDYDHGAFWFDLEPRATRHSVGADALFVGNSRMQFAFSTSATEQWFTSRGGRYYLLGFSHTENTAFVQPLLRRLQPRASVYVINVDRFFDDRATPPFHEIMRTEDSLTRYREKRRWQGVHRRLCTAWPAVCGKKLAFFRSREDGAWRFQGSGAFGPTGVVDGPATDQARWQQYAALGREFLSTLPVSPRCVVLTIAPYDGTKRLEAQAMAGALGLDLVAPQLDGLRTFDGSHLDAPSAQRWATAFFDAAGPRISECLDRSATAPGQRAPTSRTLDILRMRQ